jgi:hypothetical protein
MLALACRRSFTVRFLFRAALLCLRFATSLGPGFRTRHTLEPGPTRLAAASTLLRSLLCRFCRCLFCRLLRSSHSPLEASLAQRVVHGRIPLSTSPQISRILCSESSKPRHLRRSHFNRKRIGPLALDASTTCPPCVTTMSPVATSRRAAALAGSINASHAAFSSPPTALAASLGQMVLPAPRSRSNRKISATSALSVAPTFPLRQASLQNFTASQFFAQALRHSIFRPHAAHTFAANSPASTSRFTFRSGNVTLLPHQHSLPHATRSLSPSA